MADKKIIKPFFLTIEDEENLSKLLVAEIPCIRILDDNRWDSPEPVIKKSIAECNSAFVYLWNTQRTPTLPLIAVGSAFQGPTSGIVIQIMRSRVVEGVLLSGQMSVGFSQNNSWMEDFSKSVVRIATTLSASTLHAIGGDLAPVRTYLVGEGARSFSSAGGLLKHVTAETFYRVK
ncbi:MAG: hypothetical protein NTX35_20680 [Verrucomicrobia bacterium]|nr:hypothetical protein [Verrucomicrobiota bacterium]